MEKENKNKNLGRKIVVIGLLGGTLASVILPVVSVFAAEDSSENTYSTQVMSKDSESESLTSAEQEIYKPMFVVGGGLSNSEVEETLKLLGYDSTNDVEYLTISGDDLVRYLGSGSGNTSSMISSVLVTPTEEGEGLVLEINTPDNITLITPNQYKKAAINLGITDVTIEVASVRPVTGESALTGIYKAVESLGADVSEGQMAVANAETELFADVTENNKEDENYNPDEITQLVSELEQKVKELSEKQDGNLTEDEILDLVQKEIDKKGLGNFINEGNITLLVDTLNLYQGTPELINNEEIMKNTEEFTKDIGNQLDAGLNYLVEQVPNSDELLETSKNIFQKLWDGIVNFFSGIFGGNDSEEPVEEIVESESAVEESQVEESSENETSTLEEPITDDSAKEETVIDESNTGTGKEYNDLEDKEGTDTSVGNSTPSESGIESQVEDESVESTREETSESIDKLSEELSPAVESGSVTE